MRARVIHFAILWALVLVTAGVCARGIRSQEPETKPVDIAAAEVAKHRIGTRGPIFIQGMFYDAAKPPGFPPAELELVINTGGGVVSAKVTGRQETYFSHNLLDAAMTWTYKSFRVDGRTVMARIRETIEILPLERRAAASVPFPEIKDWNSLRITLARTICFGMCPEYTIEIHGDGSVLYQGKSGVGVEGQQRGAISKEAVQELVEAFRKADYFSLADGYISFTTDDSTHTTSIAFDDKAKWVVNYRGWDIGMPRSVSELEATIDRLSGSSKWVKR